MRFKVDSGGSRMQAQENAMLSTPPDDAAAECEAAVSDWYRKNHDRYRVLVIDTYYGEDAILERFNAMDEDLIHDIRHLLSKEMNRDI
jgi:hypothetical protein